MAMEQWVEYPHAETALSNVLPCVDHRTTNQTLVQSKKIVNQIVNVVNEFIYTYADTSPSQEHPYYYNQSGPTMPPLCYPYDNQLQDRQCGPQEVSMANASEVCVFIILIIWYNFLSWKSALRKYVSGNY
jgi:hypothetical protein